MRATKHAQRYRQIVGVLVDEGFDNALDWTGLRRFAPVKGRLRPGADAPETVPVRLRHTLERLGPTFVKIGQAASTRSDILPEDVCEELGKLQDQVAPFPADEAVALVEEELGAPIGELFAEFSLEPLAAASIGQVHAARLHGGAEVVVKVQRPGVRKLVETDLDILLTQARFAQDHSELGDTYDLVGIVGGLSEAVRDELDYLLEGRNADRLRDVFSGDETVAFPKVYWEYTTTRVLVLERMVGIPFNRLDLLDEAGMDRSLLAKRGIFCYLEQIFEHGFYHADPHPGNLFALPDGRVAFTDFGRVGTVSKVGRDQLSDLFIAIVDNDASLAVDTLVDAAGSPGDMDVPSLEREVSRLITKYYNRALDEVRVGELVGEVLDLTREHHLTMSGELAMLLTTLVVLEGLGTQLDPAFDFVEVTTPFAREIAAERYEPRAVAQALASAFRRSGRLVTEMPDLLARLMKRASTGEFRMAVKPVGLDPYVTRLEELVNRIAFAMVVSAFVLGLSILLSRGEIPLEFQWVARVLWAAALIVGSWFFVSVLFAHYRKH